MSKNDRHKRSIVFMNRVYPPGRGASGRVLRDLARSFAREGWQVSVITSGPKAGKELDNDVRVIRVKGPAKPKGAIGYGIVWLKMFMKGLSMPKANLWVTMSDPPFLVTVVQVLKVLKGGRHIHWCHDLYPDLLPALNIKLPWPFMQMGKRRAYKDMKRCDKLIVVGRCMARRLTRQGISPGHMTMIPNWPDFELVRPDMSANSKGTVNGEMPENARPFEQQRKHQPKFRVLYAGALGLAHPIGTIIGAAEILAVEHPEIEFTFVGDGPGFEKLSALREKRQLENIRFMPYQPAARLKEIMESGDVHLISVKNKAAGMLVPSKLYSALAVGRPCIYIGPKRTETAKVICDFKAGSVVPQGKPEVLAAEIKRYRMNADDWFSAHHGASEAGQIFVPKQSINAWMKRAANLIDDTVPIEKDVA